MDEFKFVDLCAGIGGLRKGFETWGGKCVLTCERDKFARKTYEANYPGEAPIVEDITTLEASDVPDHDVLLAGFPCQPFSISGVSKKNSLGHAHGFDCDTQGTIFFDVARIIEAKRPKAFLLENVKNLVRHDKGRTFKVIMQTLKGLGYHIHHKVLNAQGFVPQNRERIFIVGFREEVPFNWDDLKLPEPDAKTMASVLLPESEVEDKYTVSDKMWAWHQAHKAKHAKAGNGFGYGLVTGDDISRTLSARYHKDGAEILVSRGEGQTPRRLTPRECGRLMGYSDDHQIPVSNTQAYRQFGNSVVVPLVEEIAYWMVPHIHRIPFFVKDWHGYPRDTPSSFEKCFMNPVESPRW